MSCSCFPLLHNQTPVLYSLSTFLISNYYSKKLIDYPIFTMYTKTIFIAFLAGLATAAPAISRRADDVGKFVIVSSHSGDSNVHLRSVNANHYAFYLGKATSTNCVPQEGLDCSIINSGTTAFTFDSRTETPHFDEIVGGQEIFINTDGSLGYTGPSGALPEGGFKGPWAYAPATVEGGVGTLNFNGKGFYACPEESNVYKLYAAYVEADYDQCIGVGFTTAEYTGTQAYEYN